MTTTSATGGYLQNTATPPLRDMALAMFLQAVIVGLTGIPPSLVVPRWQPVPPAQPAATVDWAAIGVTKLHSLNPEVKHYGADNGGLGDSIMSTQKYVESLVTFYGPDAWANADAAWDGLWIGQNREALYLNGMGLQDVGDIIQTSELVNNIWLPRVDMRITFTQQTQRTYSILNLISAAGVVSACRFDGTVYTVDWETPVAN